MSETKLLCWPEALRVCLRGESVGSLAEHLARLPEEERIILLDGIDSDLLRAAVAAVLRRAQEQLALI